MYIPHGISQRGKGVEWEMCGKKNEEIKCTETYAEPYVYCIMYIIK